MLKRIKSAGTQDLRATAVLGLILAGRLALQVLLNRAGFVALTADDFGRIVVAAQWAQHPHAIWHGVWLPLYTYMFGSLFWLDWNLLYLPRIVSIAVGLLAIILMYHLSTCLFKQPEVGLLSAYLLAINPVHLWLSSTPLTEGLYIMLVLGGLVCIMLHVQEHKPRQLYLSALLLALAGGLRFEGWIISAIFSIGLLGSTLFQRRSRTEQSLPLRALIIAGIPWLFPSAWLFGTYLESGNALDFLSSIKSYKLTWYGPGRSYLSYLRTAFSIDPYLTICLVPALLGYIIYQRRVITTYWYLALALVPVAIFGILDGGQVEPPGNYLRYLAPMILVFYPIVAFCCVAAIRHVAHGRGWTSLALAGLCSVLLLTQTQRAFTFRNDPAAAGVEVGRRIRSLVQEGGPEAHRVLIELSYWQYLAIHVGANDLRNIVYDRPLNLANRSSESVFVSDLMAAQRCLTFYKIRYIVVKSPELQTVIEQRLMLHAFDEVNGYRFYQVPLHFAEQRSSSTCPLGIGEPY